MVLNRFLVLSFNPVIQHVTYTHNQCRRRRRRIAVNRQSQQQWIAVIYLDCSVGSHPNSDYVPVQNCVTVSQVKSAVISL